MKRATVALTTVLACVTWCAAGAAAEKGLLGQWRLTDGAGQEVRESVRSHPAWLGTASGPDDQDPAWADGVLVFDGKNDCVTLGAGDDFTLTDAGTLAAWVRMDKMQDREAAIVIKPASWYLVLDKDPSYLRFLYYLMAPFSAERIYTAAHSDSPVPADGRWVHVAVAFGRDAVRFYLNGYPDGIALFEGPVLTSPRNVTVGCEGASWRPFIGSIAGVSIYDRALTQEEIQQELTETAPKGALAGPGLTRPKNKGQAPPADKSGVIW